MCPRCRPLVLVLFACNGLLDPAAAAAAGGGYGGLADSLPPVPGAGAPAVAALLTRRGLNADLFDLSIAPAAHSAGRSDSAAASFAITNAAGGRVAIAGTDAVALASGARWYLAHFANASFSWWGDNVPASLASLPLPPVPAGGVHQATSFDMRCEEKKAHPSRAPSQVWTSSHRASFCRYYFNVCAFGYSTWAWDWARWEAEIDWMALNSINTPLAFVGQEHIFKSLYTSPAVGLSDADVEHFFAGPSLLPWNRMGNIKQWLGPLPQGWMESHRVLQQKILQRMRELGMRPILPGFSGLVPDAMKNKHPEASFKQAHWGAFRPTTFIGERSCYQRSCLATLSIHRGVAGVLTDCVWACMIRPSRPALREAGQGLHRGPDRRVQLHVEFVQRGFVQRDETDDGRPGVPEECDRARLLIYAERRPARHVGDPRLALPLRTRFLEAAADGSAAVWDGRRQDGDTGSLFRGVAGLELVRP